MNKDEFFKLCNTTDDGESAVQGYYKEKTINKKAKEGYFPYIAFHHEEALYHLFCKYINRSKKFLFIDVGCGTGRILYLAKEFGFKNVRGIEVIEKVAEFGRKLYGLSPEELITGDAFEKFNDEFLEDFDEYLIYTYMPISNSTIMTNLHTHVYNTLSEHRRTISPFGYFLATMAEMLPNYYPVCFLQRSYEKPYVTVQVEKASH